MFSGPFDYSILKRAQKNKKIEIDIIDIRDFGIGDHKLVDDTPYGGGVGMVLRTDVIDKAIQKTRCKSKKTCKELVILTDARGEIFTQKKSLELSLCNHLIFIAGHYEGVDERVTEHLIDRSFSIGEYVLTGGELPVMVMVDSIARLIPEVLQKKEAIAIESFSEEGMLEFPHYTKPQTYKNWSVPEVLLSGNHKKIDEWRKQHTSNSCTAKASRQK